MKKSLTDYNDIQVETDVMSASNYRLIQLLMEKCLQHIAAAKIHMDSNDLMQKHTAIKKSLDILDYLRICLNFKEPKAHEISSQLDALYAYLEKNLVQANIDNNVTYLDEATQLLSTIKEGWDGIAEKAEVNNI